jgi:hypothetical protein
MFPLLFLTVSVLLPQESRADRALVERLQNVSASAATRIAALEELSLGSGPLPYAAVQLAEPIARGIWQVDYARCLARCGPEALPDLRKLLNKHDSMIQAEAVYGIVLHDRAGGENFATRILRDSRKPAAARMAALRGLGDRGSLLAKPEALRRLATANGGVLLEALDFLKKNPMQEDVRYLVEVLENHNGRAAAEAAEMLRTITGYRVGDDPRTWRFFMVKHQADGTPFRHSSGGEQKPAPTLSYMGIPILGNRVVFVLDSSGSMDTPMAERSGETRGQRAVAELVALLPRLPKDAKFSILFFDSKVHSFARGLVSKSKKNVIAATSWLQQREFTGGTNLFGGLAEAFELKDVEEVILLSDGEPSAGEVQDVNKILAWVQRWNRWRKVRVSTVALSAPRVARQFVAKLAQENGGVCRDIR